MGREIILVVDNKEDILELVIINLAHEGYALECAATGEHALDKLTTGPLTLCTSTTPNTPRLATHRQYP